MNKEEFLDTLKIKLEENKHSEIGSIIEYYDELIEDKKEQKIKEKDIIKSLGSIDEIIKELIIENKVKIANEKPTVSNGLKAIISILGIFSLPILIPVALAVILLFLSAILVLGSLILTFACFTFAGILAIFSLFVVLFTGELSLITTAFFIGLFIAIVTSSYELMKWLTGASKKYIVWSVNIFKKKISSRKGEKHEQF